MSVSRLCHQLPQYMAWNRDLSRVEVDALREDWTKCLLLLFLISVL